MYCSLLNLRLLTVQIQGILTTAGPPLLLLSILSFISLTLHWILCSSYFQPLSTLCKSPCPCSQQLLPLTSLVLPQLFNKSALNLPSLFLKGVFHILFIFFYFPHYSGNKVSSTPFTSVLDPSHLLHVSYLTVLFLPSSLATLISPSLLVLSPFIIENVQG